MLVVVVVVVVMMSILTYPLCITLFRFIYSLLSISSSFSHYTLLVIITDLDVTVQAGIGYVELNEILRPYGVWFPLDPGPGASVGGMCACRCSGSTAVKYGSMRDNVLNIKGVLADDTGQSLSPSLLLSFSFPLLIIMLSLTALFHHHLRHMYTSNIYIGTIFKTGSRARKSSAGYDITRLLVGSEGTLGVITEATLKLHPIPKVSYALRIAFPSVSQAAACARDTLSSGLSIGRCEMLDEVVIRDINAANPTLASPWPEQVTLLYEVTGHSASSVEEQIKMVTQIAENNGGVDIHSASDRDKVAGKHLLSTLQALSLCICTIESTTRLD